MEAPGVDEALAALTFWAVPFATNGTREGTELCEKCPPGALWVVCDTLDAALSAQREGHPLILVGLSHLFENSNTQISIETLCDFADAVRPYYTRAALTLRDVIASEFEST